MQLQHRSRTGWRVFDWRWKKMVVFAGKCRDSQTGKAIENLTIGVEGVLPQSSRSVTSKDGRYLCITYVPWVSLFANLGVGLVKLSDGTGVEEIRFTARAPGYDSQQYKIKASMVELAEPIELDIELSRTK